MVFYLVGCICCVEFVISCLLDVCCCYDVCAAGFALMVFGFGLVWVFVDG